MRTLPASSSGSNLAQVHSADTGLTCLPLPQGPESCIIHNKIHSDIHPVELAITIHYPVAVTVRTQTLRKYGIEKEDILRISPCYVWALTDDTGGYPLVMSK